MRDVSVTETPGDSWPAHQLQGRDHMNAAMFRCIVAPVCALAFSAAEAEADTVWPEPTVASAPPPVDMFLAQRTGGTSSSERVPLRQLRASNVYLGLAIVGAFVLMSHRRRVG